MKHSRQKGFTLVEMMIAIAIIAMLAAIAVPAAVRAANRAQTVALINELRSTSEAFQMYAQEHNTWPPSAATFGVIPTGMNMYMPKKSTWTSSAPLGGLWYFWNVDPFGVNGYASYIGVYNPNFTTTETQLIQSTLSSGSSGALQLFSGGWILYGIN
jgi:prepilin-type N-terminal cleavage/methylation domain-containing protein